VPDDRESRSFLSNIADRTAFYFDREPIVRTIAIDYLERLSACLSRPLREFAV